jgi:endonuclease/exonuclease/phosphatase family metal-dependent hydrolase
LVLALNKPIPEPASEQNEHMETHIRLKIASWNIRYDCLPNNITIQESLDALVNPMIPPKSYFNGASKEQPWSTRRISVAQTVKSLNPDIIGFQEALIRQVSDLQELLGEEWGWIGSGREDGSNSGEFSPIFYKKSSLQVVERDMFWLSQTPFKPSKYRDAGCKRICTVGRFRILPSTSNTIRFGNDSETKIAHDVVTVLNTHLDHESEAQRKLGASLILHRARYARHTTQMPVFVMGDFNSLETGSTGGAYRITTGQLPPVQIDQEFTQRYPIPEESSSNSSLGFRLLDLRACTPRQNVLGHYATFTGFVKPEKISSYSRIDFIFGNSGGGWQSETYLVGNSLWDNGLWTSDHRPILAGVSLER